MRLEFHKNFKKSYCRLPEKIQEKLQQRLALFGYDPYDPQLNNHPLKGKYTGYRSINIGGDLRAVYKLIDSEIYFFVEIGTHSELYS